MAGGGSNLGNMSDNWGSAYDLGQLGQGQDYIGRLPQDAGANKGGRTPRLSDGPAPLRETPVVGSPAWRATHPDYQSRAPVGSDAWRATHPDYTPPGAPPMDRYRRGLPIAAGNNKRA